MTIRNVPKLRFKGFSDEWYKYMLSDISERITRKNSDLESELPLTISAQYGLVDQEIFFNRKVASKNLRKYLLIKKGEFAYNKSYSTEYPYGAIKSLIYYDKGVLSSIYVVFSLNEKVDYDFMNSFFDSSCWYEEIATKSTEGARNHGLLNISTNDFMSMLIKLPTNKIEQQKIGNFFSKLDYLIDLHSQKLEQLKKLKRGYLQKMLPQKGETVPRLRFSGFSDDWKEVKLGDILHESKTKAIDNPSDYKLLKVQLHFNGVIKTDDNPRSTAKGRKYYLRYPGELIIGKQNFHHGGFGIIPDDVKGYIASSAIVSFNINEGYNLEYVYNYMTNRDWLKRTTILIGGTGQKEYSVKTLNSLNVLVPERKEQDKISEFFNRIDHRIETEQRKLETVTMQKKAYLQKMFI